MAHVARYSGNKKRIRLVALVHEVVRVGSKSGLGRGIIALSAKADFRVVVFFIIIRVGQRGIRIHARLAFDDILDAIAIGIGVRRIGDDRVRAEEIFVGIGVTVLIGIAFGTVVIGVAQRIEGRSDRMRYNLTLVKMAIIKKSTNNKCWRGCGEKGMLLHCWWECKLIQPLWKTL